MHTEDEFWKSNLRPRILCPLREPMPPNVTAYATNMRMIVHLRDPRDSLISEYYSYGWTHPAPIGDAALVKSYLAKRAKIQAKTVDEYVLEAAPKHVEYLVYVKNMLRHPPTAAAFIFISRYTSMVETFVKWNRKVGEFLELKHSQISQLEKDFSPQMSKAKKRSSNPLNVTNYDEPPKSDNLFSFHVRDGSTKQYKQLLKEETHDRLNGLFARHMEDINDIIREQKFAGC